MKSLLMKDCYVIVKQIKLFLLIIPIFALTSGGAMSIFAVFLCASLPITAIAYDERSKWNELAIMMPYSIKDLVVSKYLLGYLGIAGAVVLSYAGQVIGKILGIESIYNEGNVMVYTILGALAFVAFNMWMLFKFGSEKGRFIFIAVMIACSALGAILAEEGGIGKVSIQPSIPLLIVIVVVMNLVSMKLSIRTQWK